jgi:hypothetical protein
MHNYLRQAYLAELQDVSYKVAKGFNNLLAPAYSSIPPTHPEHQSPY